MVSGLRITRETPARRAGRKEIGNVATAAWLIVRLMGRARSSNSGRIVPSAQPTTGSRPFAPQGRHQFLRGFFDGADRESLVIVPLQQAADCFLAPAALVSAPTRLVVFGNVLFAAHRRPPNLRKGWSIKFSI